MALVPAADLSQEFASLASICVDSPHSGSLYLCQSHLRRGLGTLTGLAEAGNLAVSQVSPIGGPTTVAGSLATDSFLNTDPWTHVLSASHGLLSWVLI